MAKPKKMTSLTPAESTTTELVSVLLRDLGDASETLEVKTVYSLLVASVCCPRCTFVRQSTENVGLLDTADAWCSDLTVSRE